MVSLWSVKNYLRHRFKATTRHGLHSPFVYRLVDKVIYDHDAKKVYPEIGKVRPDAKNASKSPKLDQLIYRLVADLKPDNLIELGQLSEITKLYLQKASPGAKVYRDINNSPAKLDFVLINGIEEAQTIKYFQQCLPKVHESTMLVINGIYHNKGSKQAWTEIKANPKVAVTIDLFWIGLVFFRSGQVREDFLIRL